jgi:fimbrial chaperone protein
MNTQKTALAAAVIAACSLLAPVAAEAGVFSVTPVRIYMTPRDRAVALTITNEGDAEVVLQADIHVWTQQPDGTDELVLTEDMILSPPIIKLASKARQVVRLALLRPADAGRQLTYRLVVREVPEANTAQSNVVEVPIALALSMPVFITPRPAARQIECRAERAADAITAVCSNAGSAYAQVRQVTLRQGAAALAQFEGGEYILPGARKTIALKAQQQAPAAGAAQLSVLFDDGKNQVFDVTLP